MSCFGDRTTRTISFGNKDGGIFLRLNKVFPVFYRWLIIEVNPAIPKLFVVKIGFFGTVICKLSNATQFFTFPFALFNPLLDGIGGSGVLMKEVI